MDKLDLPEEKEAVLKDAASRGDVAELAVLVPLFSVIDADGCSIAGEVIACAVGKGDEKLAKFLLKAGADKDYCR